MARSIAVPGSRYLARLLAAPRRWAGGMNYSSECIDPATGLNPEYLALEPFELGLIRCHLLCSRLHQHYCDERRANTIGLII